jgi:hypothetical protein
VGAALFAALVANVTIRVQAELNGGVSHICQHIGYEFTGCAPFYLRHTLNTLTA